MPRQARLDIPGALHHIMVRGINKSDIFLDDQDKQQFLERLALNLADTKCAVYAWALMSNHVHLLFKSGEHGISEVMRKQLTWYAMYFNRKYKRSGHLFENRYRSILCEEDQYLLTLIRYIHLNPVRAGIITSLQELDCYPWTGHSVVMGQNERDWMDTDYVLTQFGTRLKRARTAYRKFIEEGLTQGHIPAFSGGGLRRSHGGWSAVVSLKSKGEELKSDDRILGSSDFVKNLLEEIAERDNRQFNIRRSERNISDIIEEQSKKMGISRREIKSGSRRQKISRARSVIARICAVELGMTNADIARCLGVNTSTITRVLNKPENVAK